MAPSRVLISVAALAALLLRDAPAAAAAAVTAPEEEHPVNQTESVQELYTQEAEGDGLGAETVEEDTQAADTEHPTSASAQPEPNKKTENTPEPAAGEGFQSAHQPETAANDAAFFVTPSTTQLQHAHTSEAEPLIHAQQEPPAAADTAPSPDREQAETQRLKREREGQASEERERENQQRNEQLRREEEERKQLERLQQEQPPQPKPQPNPESVPSGEQLAGTEPRQEEKQQPGAATDDAEDAVAADPRLGPCTREELNALSEHFADGTACPAYSCIDTESNNYQALIEQHYPSKYTAEEAGVLAGVLAACHCRCPVMRCEVEYIAQKGSDSCKAATKDFCLQSNTKFSDKCSQVAMELPKVYDIEADPHAFKRPCQVCELEAVATDVPTGSPALQSADSEGVDSESENVDTSSAPVITSLFAVLMAVVFAFVMF